MNDRLSSDVADARIDAAIAAGLAVTRQESEIKHLNETIGNLTVERGKLAAETHRLRALLKDHCAFGYCKADAQPSLIEIAQGEGDESPEQVRTRLCVEHRAWFESQGFVIVGAITDPDVTL